MISRLVCAFGSEWKLSGCDSEGGGSLFACDSWLSELRRYLKFDSETQSSVALVIGFRQKCLVNIQFERQVSLHSHSPISFSDLTPHNATVPGGQRPQSCKHAVLSMADLKHNTQSDENKNAGSVLSSEDILLWLHGNCFFVANSFSKDIVKWTWPPSAKVERSWRSPFDVNRSFRGLYAGLYTVWLILQICSNWVWLQSTSSWCQSLDESRSMTLQVPSPAEKHVSVVLFAEGNIARVILLSKSFEGISFYSTAPNSANIDWSQLECLGVEQSLISKQSRIIDRFSYHHRIAFEAWLSHVMSNVRTGRVSDSHFEVLSFLFSSTPKQFNMQKLYSWYSIRIFLRLLDDPEAAVIICSSMSYMIKMV